MKIFHRRFAVQIKSKSNGTFSTNISETKKGRRKGASPPVSSMLRMDLVCSDLPPIFNFNPFFMQTKNDKRNATSVQNSTPPSLTEAVHLLGRAKNLILAYHESNPRLKDCNWDDVCKIEDLLIQSAYSIRNLAGVHFLEKHFFGIGEEVNL